MCSACRSRPYSTRGSRLVVYKELKYRLVLRPRFSMSTMVWQRHAPNTHIKQTAIKQTNKQTKKQQRTHETAVVSNVPTALVRCPCLADERSTLISSEATNSCRGITYVLLLLLLLSGFRFAWVRTRNEVVLSLLILLPPPTLVLLALRPPWWPWEEREGCEEVGHRLLGSTAISTKQHLGNETKQTNRQPLTKENQLHNTHFTHRVTAT